MDIQYNYRGKPSNDKQNCRIIVTPLRGRDEPWVENGISLGRGPQGLKTALTIFYFLH